MKISSTLSVPTAQTILDDNLIDDTLRPEHHCRYRDGLFTSRQRYASYILKSKTPLLDAEINRILRDDVLQNVEQSKGWVPGGYRSRSATDHSRRR
jgi:hypothetical protein